MGAVGALRHCKQAILAARRVLENTEHSLLVGLQATQFAVEMAVPLDNLTTEKSHSMWKDWYTLVHIRFVLITAAPGRCGNKDFVDGCSMEVLSPPVPLHRTT